MPLLLPTGPLVASVVQGDVGICYFLASVAAIAHHQPQLLREMLDSPKKSQSSPVSPEPAEFLGSLLSEAYCIVRQESTVNSSSSDGDGVESEEVTKDPLRNSAIRSTPEGWEKLTSRWTQLGRTGVILDDGLEDYDTANIPETPPSSQKSSTRSLEDTKKKSQSFLKLTSKSSPLRVRFERYPQVLARAWRALFCGSDWTRVQGGTAAEALSTLTKAPVDIVEHASISPDELFDDVLLAGLSDNFPMVAATRELENNIGLPVSHELAVLGVKSRPKRVMLYDPHGETSYSGELSSDTGGELHPALGYLSVSLSEFTKHFSSTALARVVREASPSHVAVPVQAGGIVSALFEVEVPAMSAERGFSLRLEWPTGRMRGLSGESNESDETSLSMEPLRLRGLRFAAVETNEGPIERCFLEGARPRVLHGSPTTRFEARIDVPKKDSGSSVSFHRYLVRIGAEGLPPWASRLALHAYAGPEGARLLWRADAVTAADVEQKWSENLGYDCVSLHLKRQGEGEGSAKKMAAMCVV